MVDNSTKTNQPNKDFLSDSEPGYAIACSYNVGFNYLNLNVLIDNDLIKNECTIMIIYIQLKNNKRNWPTQPDRSNNVSRMFSKLRV